MSPSTTKWLGRIFISLLVLAFGASGYGLYRLDTERKALHQEIESLNNRAALLQKKISEQKALTESMRRNKQEVESQARDLAFNLAKLEKKNTELESAIADHENKMAAMRTSCEETIASHKERYESLHAALENLRDESNTIIREKNQQINLVSNERDALDASLKQETFQRQRCVEHNSRFAVLTEELVQRYENKGVLSSVGQIEPFTQLKKVEVEKICQEYRDRIDENALPKK